MEDKDKDKIIWFNLDKNEIYKNRYLDYPSDNFI